MIEMIMMMMIVLMNDGDDSDDDSADDDDDDYHSSNIITYVNNKVDFIALNQCNMSVAIVSSTSTLKRNSSVIFFAPL